MYMQYAFYGLKNGHGGVANNWLMLRTFLSLFKNFTS